MRHIRRTAVLGSGVMGGAIAAHLANCGIPSLMLDIVPPNLPEADAANKAKRNSIAATSKQNLAKLKPSPVFLQSNLDLIEIGNLDDDLPRIAECDWIIEVVKEDLAIKRALLERVAKHRKPGTVVSTNTSGVLISAMVDVMDADMRKHFLGTHFFNPPRYLKLLEIIPGKDTLPEVVAFMADFGERVLGKGVVYAKDTPNFVGNRILTFGCQYLMTEMVRDGLTIEEVDALTGPIIGHASSATFRTSDLVGLDTYVHVIANVYNNCPNDEHRDLYQPTDWMNKMLEKKLLGAKTGSGFFKKTDQKDEKGKPVILTLDLNTLEYRPPVKVRLDCIGAARNVESLDEQIKIMHTAEDKGSKFLWKSFAHSAIYAGNRIPEIADDVVNIDNAVRWGFSWKRGIFETWDILGFDYVCDRMKKDGLTLPPIAQAMVDGGHHAFYKEDAKGNVSFFDLATKSYKPLKRNANAISLASVKKANGVVKENEFCSLVDLGDGILCAEFHSKMNSIERYLCEIIMEGVTMLNDGKFDGMVLGNQEPHFSVGANLMMILGEVMQGNWDNVTKVVNEFQALNMAMRFSSRPVVATPHNYTFGGGLEMAQHTARCVVNGETYGGLVEVGVGLIPAGGGCKEMLRRAQAYVPANVIGGDLFPFVRRAFENIAMAKVSTSGPELVELGYLTTQDVICANWDHQIKRAKDVCLALLQAGYTAPQPAELVALGEPARAAFRTGVYQLKLGGYASEHDALIAEKLAIVLTGGNRAPGSRMTEQDVLDLEREEFLSLCGTEKTQQRMQHMLASGKPLRN
ncbi:MAG: 3-hydroxyacyl-CoA dehydrogenase/enoyl-CoA hydratase family protein [Candidatus Hydrogenedentes bacterium]|nr:3-hydroxyacyl-CoA dehydrogenase/enoyl-CoA hydratase family protein [Candidatus Hydrogenedentota bacterium]